MPGPVPVLGPALSVLGPHSEPAGAALGRPRRRLALALGFAAALLSAAGIIIAVALSSTEPNSQPPALADRSVPPEPTMPSLVPTPRAQPEAAAPEAEREPFDAASAAEGADEVVAVAEATPPDEVEPSVDPPRTRARRSRRRSRTATPEADAPEAEPAPTPVARPAKPSPPSATELLGKAEAALARGDADEAYRLAARSRRTRASDDASAVMARAACRMGDTDKAKQALRALPLLQRAGVRRDCRQSGSRIGL